MKYKLLQPLPFVTPGTMFQRSQDNNFGFDSFNCTEWQNELIKSIINNTDWFEPIPETKTQHFHKNGSVCEGLGNKTKYFCQDFDGAVEERRWEDNDFGRTRLANHNVFLTIESCQKATDDQAVYNRLYLKVKQIDEENAFICDWNNGEWNKYHIYYGVNPVRYYSPSACENCSQGTIYMSKQSAEYLLSDAVTDAERETWINY